MSGTSPFKFLDAYNKEDSDIFFGRDAEVERLYDLVFQSNISLVYGESGTGKTSLVQCGLANRFAQSDWFNIYIRRNENISKSLYEAISRFEIQTPQPTGLHNRLRKRRLAAAQSRKMKSDTKEKYEDSSDATIAQLNKLYKYFLKPIYLIFDQFEELYILGNREEQEKFYETVADILEFAPFCRIIIIMREEMIAQLYDFEKVIPFLFEKRLRVEAMSPSKSKEVIEKTTQKFEIILQDKDVPFRIIHALSGDKGKIELTYLQVFMDRLYQESSSRNQGEIIFDADVIDSVGNIEDVLGSFLDKQISGIQQQLEKKFPNASPGTVKKNLGVFVTLEGTKRPIERSQLGLDQNSKEAKQTEFIVNQLESARILRFEDGFYELSHDTLAKKIAEQRSSEEIALLETSKLISDRYQAYDATKTLLNNNELQLIETVKDLLKRDNILSDEEWDFVRRSDEANKKAQRRRFIIVSAIITVLAALVIVSSYFAIRARNALIQFTNANYQKHIETANSAFATSDYDKAVVEFGYALDIKPESEAAKTGIEEAQNKAENRAPFEALIVEGDSLINLNNELKFVDALNKYEAALALEYNDQLSNIKIEAAESKLKVAYSTLKEAGERFFQSGERSGQRQSYQDALNMFNEAARIPERLRPSNDNLEQRISETRQKIN